LDHFI